MKTLLRLLPQSLLERVFAIYGIVLFVCILAGLGAYYHHEFNQAVDDAIGSATLTVEVIEPGIADSVITGDYDAVQRTLDRVLIRPEVASIVFIDSNGGVLRAKSTRAPRAQAPDWLQFLAKRSLTDIERAIVAGGNDYGVLRLQLSPEHIAGEIWMVTRTALLMALACFILGTVLMRIPLRRWMGNLDLIRSFEWESDAGTVGPKELLRGGIPLEIRRTLDAFQRTAASLQIQRARADVTLGAIAEGVVTVNAEGNIAYVNPLASRLFQPGPEPLLGRDLRTALPQEIVALFDQGTAEGARNGRIKFDPVAGGSLILECSWVPITEVSGTAAGSVLTCRDVTEAHELDFKLRAELQTRGAALDSLRNAVREMGAGAYVRLSNDEDIPAVAEFLGYLAGERARVTALLEDSVRELDFQKRALDAHSIVSITDASGVITYVNDKFVEISGYGAQELIGQNHRIIRSGLHTPEFYRTLWSTICAGQVWHGQIANRKKSGDIYWVECTIVPRMGADGRPDGYIAIRTDITRTKEIELALQDARERELAIGASIQQSLLKDAVPDSIEGAWLASFAEASNGIDGDFLALHSYRPGCFEFLVGDVMGKGVPAALIGAGIKAAYNQALVDLLIEHAHGGALPAPAEIVNRLHQVVTPRLIELASFATLALYRFDLEAGTLTYVCAGHTPGLLMRALEAQSSAIMGDNLPIGVMLEEQYVQSSVRVGPGDCLMVYSDGITEARAAAGEEFGLERLRAVLRACREAGLPPAAVLHHLRQELHWFASPDETKDDRTALMVELRPRRRAPRGRVEQRMSPVTISLPWNFEALAALRLRLAESACGLAPEAVHALTLAAQEAATNIIRHAPPLVERPTLVCRITRTEQGIEVELIYPSTAFVPPAQVQADLSGGSEGGFGLYIIAQSVDSVEYSEPVPGIASIRLVKRAGAVHEPDATGNP